jgi:hypothetical protein
VIIRKSWRTLSRSPGPASITGCERSLSAYPRLVGQDLDPSTTFTTFRRQHEHSDNHNPSYKTLWD